MGHFGDPLSFEMFILPARRKDTGRIPEECQTSIKRPLRKPGIALQFYLYAGRIPEGCRKGNRHPLSGLLTDLLTGLLTDPLTDLLISGELRQARRLGLPEGYRKDSRSFL